jgi:hypothetical protein
MSDYYELGDMSAGCGDIFDDGDTGSEVPGGYGNHTLGFGHPLDIKTLFPVEGTRIIDLGGDRRTFRDLAGTWPDGPFTLEVDGIECYSGIAGQGNSLYPNDDKSEFVAIMPHLFGTEGLVDVILYPPVGDPIVYPDAMQVVKHPGRSGGVFFAARMYPSVYRLPTYRRR